MDVTKKKSKFGSNGLYQIEQLEPGIFKAKKFNADLEFQHEYTLSEVSHDSVICTCFAGARPTCRHRQMLRLFQGLGKIGTREYYDMGNDTWHDYSAGGEV